MTRRMQHHPKALGWPETYKSPRSLLCRQSLLLPVTFTLIEPWTPVHFISSVRFWSLGSPAPILHEGMFQFGQNTTGWNIFSVNT